MTGKRLANLVRCFQRLTGFDAVAASDSLLLERYLQSKDEVAFELLVWRHGSMVLNVCRRVVRHEQDAEDAFQAVFLTLARKARGIRRGQALSGWLYRVAYRIAVQSAQRVSKRARHEIAVANPGELQAAAEPATARAAGPEISAILDDELSRLPERLRLPIVLCYLEGKSNAEAARQLGCPAGTIFSRLARGRELLRARLVRRGLGASALAACSTWLPQNVQAAGPTALLVAAAARSALLFGAGKTAAISSQVTTLAEGVLKAMLLQKIKVAALLVLALGLLGTGGLVMHHALSAASPLEQAATGNPPVGKNPPVADNPPAADDPAEPRTAVIRVRAVKPTPGGPDRALAFSGVFQALEKVEVLSPAAGFLKEMRANAEDKVKKGDLLAEIDAPFAVLDVKQAEVIVQQADAGVAEAQAQLATTQAELKAAEKHVDLQNAKVKGAKAELKFRDKHFRRLEELYKSAAVEARLVDEEKNRHDAAELQLVGAVVGVESAKAELDVKRAHIMRARAAVKSAQAQMALAQLGQEKARVRLGFSRIVAPFDGVIGQVNYSAGAYVRGAEQGSRPLFTIMRLDVMRAVVDVAEQHIRYVKPGAIVSLAVPALPDVHLKGKVRGVIYRDDEKSPPGFLGGITIGAARAEILVPNADGLLRPGMTGSVKVTLKGSPKSVTLPESCVFTDGAEKSAVFVIRGGKAYSKAVRTGNRTQGRVEIVSGVALDDVVVSDPDSLSAAKAADGIPVEVRRNPPRPSKQLKDR